MGILTVENTLDPEFCRLGDGDLYEELLRLMPSRLGSIRFEDPGSENRRQEFLREIARMSPSETNPARTSELMASVFFYLTAKHRGTPFSQLLMRTADEFESGDQRRIRAVIPTGIRAALVIFFGDEVERMRLGDAGILIRSLTDSNQLQRIGILCGTRLDSLTRRDQSNEIPAPTPSDSSSFLGALVGGAVLMYLVLKA